MIFKIEGVEQTFLTTLPFSHHLRTSIQMLYAYCIARDESWRVFQQNQILADYDQNDALALRNHFVEPMVYFCMLQPSSTRDRLAQVATNGIHQANLCTQAGYKDVLDQDRLMPGKFLGRPRTERQLARLAKHWAGADRLLAALQSLDSESYRQQTFDYRNRASHFIAPRLELGEVQFVTRSIVPATRMVQQPDGSYRQKEIDGKKVVANDLGGIRPLTLNEIIETNSSPP
jgi:hypothetical protein